jgi:hypothetical protein
MSICMKAFRVVRNGQRTAPQFILREIKALKEVPRCGDDSRSLMTVFVSANKCLVRCALAVMLYLQWSIKWFLRRRGGLYIERIYLE